MMSRTSRIPTPLPMRWQFKPLSILPRIALPNDMARAWLKHNVEEVGNFENFLPDLYRGWQAHGDAIWEQTA
ncbi:MAG TPA: hypothetical protein PKA05_19390 [Roseiflexaceae bacterium]|nr:hypothetical protein [Roseiflexaceae bacterium]HMP42552.1 hypothetical protein [Roseiflexaceae bacterium]